MGALRRIVVHLSDATHAEFALRSAIAIAAWHDAEVVAVHAVEPPTPAYLTPEVSAIAAELAARAGHDHRLRVEAMVRDVGGRVRLEEVPAEALADPAATVLRLARAADLLVLPRPDPSRPDGTRPGFAARLLVGAGCPVLVVPVAAPGEPAPGRSVPDVATIGPGASVVVGWSASRGAARALRDAVPLIRGAARIDLVSVVPDPDPDADGAVDRSVDEAIAHLRRHGVHASAVALPVRSAALGGRLRRPGPSDAAIVDALLAHATRIDADLLVMGAYGHSPAWEAALGGLTRTMLQSARLPVLMSH